MSRDWSIPLTDSEIADFKDQFCKMPSFNNGCISSEDAIVLTVRNGYARTEEQTKAYKEYIDKQMGGLVELEDFMGGLRSMHSTSKLARHRATQADKDGNGYISAEEFKILYELLRHVDPKIPSVGFEEFVKQADSNNDGKVSIDECEKWILSITNS